MSITNETSHVMAFLQTHRGGKQVESLKKTLAADLPGKKTP